MRDETTVLLQKGKERLSNCGSTQSKILRFFKQKVPEL